MIEVFKPIKGYDNHYLISNFGRVKSLKPKNHGKIIVNSLDKDGYHLICLCKQGVKKTKRIHQLVFDAFHFMQRVGSNLIIDHIDNVRTNNTISNLRLVTFRENVANRIDSHTFRSEYPGVVFAWNTTNKRWKVRKTVNGVRKYLGYFKSEEEAHEAYTRCPSY